MRHSTRRGFTLIELLVVIGIILVLIAIVVMGMRHVNNTAARHETEVELKLCMDMLKEYQDVNGLNIIETPFSATVPGAQLVRLPQPPWLNKFFTPPLFMDAPAGTAEVVGTSPGVQPSSALATVNFAGNSTMTAATSGKLGDMGDKGDPNNPRWGSDAVIWTQCLMFIVLKDPKNRALISTLPPKRILESPPPTVDNNNGNPNAGPNPPYTIDGAVPLDGWGNPIVFVPRGGMHVWINPTNASAPQEYVIRTSGVYQVSGGPNPLPPISPSDHPFFASAGQDGYFLDVSGKVDRSSDNVYSFQEQ